jgi:hypothetical protein
MLSGFRILLLKFVKTFIDPKDSDKRCQKSQVYHQVAQTAVTVETFLTYTGTNISLCTKMFEFEVGYQKCIIESVVSSSIDVRNSSPYGIPHHNALASVRLLTG